MKQVRNLFITVILALISIPAFSQGSLAEASEECRRSVAFYNEGIQRANCFASTYIQLLLIAVDYCAGHA